MSAQPVPHIPSRDSKHVHVNRQKFFLCLSKCCGALLWNGEALSSPINNLWLSTEEARFLKKPLAADIFLSSKNISKYSGDSRHPDFSPHRFRKSKKKFSGIEKKWSPFDRLERMPECTMARTRTISYSVTRETKVCPLQALSRGRQMN